MNQKLNKILSALCTTCMGIIGFMEYNHISILFFGEPKHPALSDDNK